MVLPFIMDIFGPVTHEFITSGSSASKSYKILVPRPAMIAFATIIVLTVVWSARHICRHPPPETTEFPVADAFSKFEYHRRANNSSFPSSSGVGIISSRSTSSEVVKLSRDIEVRRRVSHKTKDVRGRPVKPAIAY